MQGTVLQNNGSWGFIAPHDATADNIFYHVSNLLGGRKRLFPGEVVEYDIGQHNGRPTATNIRVIKASSMVRGNVPQAVL